MALLTVERACKAFGALKAVDEVSFEIRTGEILGIAGPNGSGKSTLFNLVTGMPFPPDRGRIAFAGRELHRMAPEAIARLGIARTFQKDAVFPELTARQNVRIGAVYGCALRDPEGRTEAALDRVRIDPDRRDRKAGTLSTWDQKRLMIASALAMAPKILMMDEPASGLTPPEIEELAALVRSLREDGTTILLIEHVLPLLLSVSERLLVMNHGRLLLSGSPDEVVRDPRVVEAYLGRRAADAAALH